MQKQPIVISSLDESFGPGIERMFQSSFERGLLDGMLVGVLRDGETFLRVAGNGLAADSGFEIGSTTKTFTIELMNVLVERGAINWDDAVVDYLPGDLGERGKRIAQANRVTLLDVAIHRAGLPLLPPNLSIPDNSNPFGHYPVRDLEHYLGQLDFERPLKPAFVYSNFGFALLGYLMEQATAKSYAELLRREVLEPLGLSRTALAIAGGELPELVQGYTQSGRPASRWVQDTFAPAGALCSTATDQLEWIRVLLENSARNTLRVYNDERNGEYGLGWAIHPSGTSFTHDGITGGFTSYLGVNTETRSGLVLLTNRKCSLLMKALAANCERSLRNLPLSPLQGNYGKAVASVLDPLRELKGRVSILDQTWRFLKNEKRA